jgi:hypothetical protein
MTHSFDIVHAQKYGLNEAIIIHNFQFWITKNRANKTHNHDGRTWTYNSVKAFEELFPYLKYSQIRRCLESLVEQEVLVKGEYNNGPYDRTCWYAFNDESMFLDKPLDLSNLTTRDSQFDNSITDNKPYSKPYRNSKTSLPLFKNEESEENGMRPLASPSIREIDERGLSEAVESWLQYKKERKQSYKGASSIQAMINKLYDLSNGDEEIAVKIVQHCMASNYSGLFPLPIERVNKFAPVPYVRPAQNTNAMMSQDNHSNYADYVAWCKKNNVTPEKEEI